MKIVNCDFLDYNIGEADIITLYLFPETLSELSSKLKREAKSGCRIVSHDYEIPGWQWFLKEEIPTIGYHVHKIFVYIL